MLRSLKTQLLAGQLALVVLLTLALGGGIFHAAQTILEGKEEEEVRLIAGGLARETALTVHHARTHLELILASPDLEQFRQTHNFHQLQALFDRNREMFAVLAYITADGVREYVSAGPGYSDRETDLAADRLVAEALRTPGVVASGLRVPPGDACAMLALALARRTAFGEFAGCVLAAVPIKRLAEGVLALRLNQGGFGVLADARGTLLSLSSPDEGQMQVAEKTPLATALAAGSPTLIHDAFAGRDSLIAIAPLGMHDLSALVVLPRQRVVDEPLRRFRATATAIAITASCLAALAVLWWTGGIVRPLARLAEAARSVSGGDLDVRAPDAGPAETRALAKAFNAMTEDLAASRTAMERSRRSMENILANMNEALLVVDRQGRVVMCNQSGCRMLGYEADEILGLPATVIFPPDDPLCAFLESASLQDLLAGGGITGLEKTLRGKDGRNLPVLVSLARLRDPDALAEGVVCLAMDIAERKRADDLSRARRATEAVSRAKTEFLGVLSHEMRTPLNIILGVLEHLQDLHLPQASQAAVSQAGKSGQALLEVITAMLDYASLEAGRVILRRRPFSPARLAMDVADRFAAPARAKGMTLALDVAQDLPPSLLGDPDRLGQALANLLSNAVRFTMGGEARLFLGGAPIGPENTRWQLLAVVSDTGMGVTDAKLEYIFEPFTQEDASSTRRFGGLGLGLAIARRLVALMGGSLCMDSRPGQGTDVYVSLPLERGV